MPPVETPTETKPTAPPKPPRIRRKDAGAVLHVHNCGDQFLGEIILAPGVNVAQINAGLGALRGVQAKISAVSNALDVAAPWAAGYEPAPAKVPADPKLTEIAPNTWMRIAPDCPLGSIYWAGNRKGQIVKVLEAVDCTTMYRCQCLAGQTGSVDHEYLIPYVPQVGDWVEMLQDLCGKPIGSKWQISEVRPGRVLCFKDNPAGHGPVCGFGDLGGVFIPCAPPAPAVATDWPTEHVAGHECKYCKPEPVAEPQPQYKVGDLVKVVRNSGKVRWHDGGLMNQAIGKVYPVVGILLDRIAIMGEGAPDFQDGRWHYHPDDLEPYTPEPGTRATHPTLGSGTIRFPDATNRSKGYFTPDSSASVDLDQVIGKLTFTVEAR